MSWMDDFVSKYASETELMVVQTVVGEKKGLYSTCQRSNLSEEDYRPPLRPKKHGSILMWVTMYQLSNSQPFKKPGGPRST